MILGRNLLGVFFLNKNATGLVITVVVLSSALLLGSVSILQTDSEDPNLKMDELKEKREEKKETKIDKTPPVIIIDYILGEEGTDENPGAWDVFAYDDESGINYDTINVSIDDILIGNSFTIYNVPSTIGDHSILVEVMNDNSINPLLGTGSNTVSIIDDDTAPPELSNLIIECNFNFVNISLTATDYSGIDEFKILVNEEVITHIHMEENESNFIFVLKNKWFLECGTNNVEIQAIDGDNDRENDSLSSSIYGTFEIGIDDRYQFIIWKIEEIKSYIIKNLEFKFKNCLICKLSMAQDCLKEALCCFEDEKITTSLFYDLKAKLFLWITEKKLVKSHHISHDDFKFIIDELHSTRNCIVILMGGSIGNEMGNNIAYIEINLLNLIDYSRDGRSIFCLENLIRSALFKLDQSVIFLSMGKNPTYLLDCTQSKLQRVIYKVDYLLNKGVISQDIGNHIKNIIIQAVEDIEILKALF